MRYLFLVNIGPVQSFIASARRTRDLWFGSRLLSELAKEAAREIANRGGILIFPAPASEDDPKPNPSLNAPNKILALIHHEPEEVGKGASGAIEKRLNEIRDGAYDKIRDKYFYQEDTYKGHTYKYKEIAHRQVQDLVEYFWVALPFDKSDDEDAYLRTRHQLEALMAARKNTRDFSAVPWGSTMPKSSIDGQIESVIPEHHYPNRNDSDQEKSRKIGLLHKHYRAKPAERLSGVDLLKRLGEFQSTPQPEGDAVSAFPSTSHIAAVPYLQCLETLKDSNQVKQKWDTYIESVKVLTEPEVISGYDCHPLIGRYDGSFFFVEQLLEMGIEKEHLKKPQEALEAFFRSVDNSFGRKLRPAPYYAILQADGDGMGEVIDKLAEGEQGYCKHQDLSRALDVFAEAVKGVVKKHRGVLIYAGGDDVLALVPVHTVLPCAHELTTVFGSALEKVIDGKDYKPTLSVGVAIVHHLSLLQESLEIARQAEKKAKTVPGKNALAITVSKRSGEDHTVAGQWGALDRQLQELITLYHSKDIPRGMAYELREMAQRLAVPSKHPDFDKLQNVIRADAERILKHKLEVPKDKKAQGTSNKEEALGKLKKVLDAEQDQSQKLSEDANGQPGAKAKPVPITEFIDKLLVARVLAEAVELADAKPKKDEAE